MRKSELWVKILWFMCKSELWVNMRLCMCKSELWVKIIGFMCLSELWVNRRWFMCKSELWMKIILFMFKSELWVNTRWFMFKSELWVRGDRGTDKHARTHTHINTMTRPGLGAWPSENALLFGIFQFTWPYLLNQSWDFKLVWDLEYLLLILMPKSILESKIRRISSLK